MATQSTAIFAFRCNKKACVGIVSIWLHKKLKMYVDEEIWYQTHKKCVYIYIYVYSQNCSKHVIIFLVHNRLR